ncbi:MAG: diguanylate cyclase [Lachnospiraceae bacterium]|nr:diguanylate cyclase [Lachnospiraceae bacterium]
MKKKQIHYLFIISFIVVLLLAGSAIVNIRYETEKMTQYCFQDLNDECEALAKTLKDSIQMDDIALQAMAAMVADKVEEGDQEILKIVNVYNTSASYVSYVEILWPDNHILRQDGATMNASKMIDFDKEAKKGKYISDKEKEFFEPNEPVIRNAVPVIHNGETIAMLYGIVSLRDMAERYVSTAFDGDAYVYLIDGNTGDFLLDTWHKSLGNIKDLTGRKMLPGYDRETELQNLENGTSANMAFISKTIGQPLYLHSNAVGINNWSVMLTVSEDVAFEKTRSITKFLYLMTLWDTLILFFYIGCIIQYVRGNLKEKNLQLKQIEKMGSEDQTTELQNRNRYDRQVKEWMDHTFDTIVCIYMDANGLHEINNRYGHDVGDQMLRIIANSIKEEFEYQEIYRIGGDEFLVISQRFTEVECREKVKRIVMMIEKKDYHVAVGIKYRENEIGLNRIIREADEEMLEQKRQYYEKKDRRVRT